MRFIRILLRFVRSVPRAFKRDLIPTLYTNCMPLQPPIAPSRPISRNPALFACLPAKKGLVAVATRASEPHRSVIRSLRNRLSIVFRMRTFLVSFAVTSWGFPIFSREFGKITREILQFCTLYLRMSCIDKLKKRGYNQITKSFKYV